MQRIIRAFLDKPIVMPSSRHAESLEEMLSKKRRLMLLDEGKEGDAPGASSFQLWLEAHRAQARRGPLQVGAKQQQPLDERTRLRDAVEARLVARVARLGDSTDDEFYDNVDL